jgi:AcrR family transcriptional regulator
MAPRRTKQEQSESTRAALMGVARRLFGERGYAGTATEDIVAGAGVTRGALYHQFKDKRDLFIAVLDQIQLEVLGRLGAAAVQHPTASPLQQLRRAFQMYLDITMEPEVQRIVLLDGRSVLGWGEWQRMEEAHGLPVVVGALEAAMAAGEIERQPAEPLAHLLLGAVNEAAFNIAASDDPAGSRQQLGAALDRLVSRL